MKKINAISFVFLILFILIILSGVISLFSKTGLQGLKETLVSYEFIFAVKFSIATSLISLLLSLIFSIPIAYFLSRVNFPLKQIVESIIDIPIFLPPLITGLSFLILFGGSFGKIIERFGISFLFSPLGVIFAQFIIITPYIERSAEIAFFKVNKRYEFMGKIMGLSDFDVFRRIVFPLSKKGILTGAIVGWSRAMGEFGATLMIAGATRLRTETLPISVYLSVSSGDIKFAAGAGVLMVIVAVLTLFIVRGVIKENAYH